MLESIRQLIANRRVWLGVLLTVVLCGTLACLSPSTVWKTLANSRPEWAIAGLGCFSLSLIFRGVRLSLLAATPATPVSAWVHCAARHQILSSLLPSASGDLGFPYVANKLCGLSYSDGTRVVAFYRFQDLVALAALFVVGAAFLSQNLLLIGVAIALVPVTLFWSDRLVGVLFRWALSFFSKLPLFGMARLKKRISSFVEVQSTTQPSANSTSRAQLVGCTVLSWMMAVATFWCLFAMVGQFLGFGTVCVIVAALNLFGVVNALTIGGLGIGESALATILLALNYGYESAVSTAFVVRPTALVIAITSCLLVELVSRALGSKAVVCFAPASEMATSSPANSNSV